MCLLSGAATNGTTAAKNHRSIPMKKTLTATAALAIVVAVSFIPNVAGGLVDIIKGGGQQQPHSIVQVPPAFNLGGPAILNGGGKPHQ
jgi:hypothetical protein